MRLAPSASVLAHPSGPPAIPYAPCRRVGDGSHHHFFGGYDKTAWDRDDRLLAAHRTPWMDAPLTPRSRAAVGYFDTHARDRFHPVGETGAWNWQIGSQLQWLCGLPGRQLIYNDRAADGRGFVSVIVDIDTGARRGLPRPVYAVAPCSRWALSVDYRRLHRTHGTIGYGGEDDPSDLPPAPADDGIWRLDLAGGGARLLVSYDALRRFHPRPSMDRAVHWVSHLGVNPASSRVLFLHRWTERVADATRRLHRLITMDPDGADMRLLECSDRPPAQPCGRSAAGASARGEPERLIAHPTWRDDSRVLAWSSHAGALRHHLYHDAPGGAVEAVGPGTLLENGHATSSPADPRWLLSDTRPDERAHLRYLFLYDTRTGRRHNLGRFFAEPSLSEANRCDLHPRWSRDGRQVCIDSVHEGQRQMYVLDVSAIV